MHILYLHTHFSTPGGGSRYAVESANRLVEESNTEVSIVTQEFDHSLYDISKDVALIQYGGAKPTSIKHWLNLPINLQRLQNSISELPSKPDIAVSHSIPMPYWSELVKRQLPNSKYIWFAHDPNFYLNLPGALDDVPQPLRMLVSLTKPLLRPIDRTLINRNIDTIIANSSFTENIVSEHYKVDSEVIYPGIDCDDFTPHGSSPLKEEYVFSVGRLNKYKNYDSLIEAWRHLCSSSDNVPKLVIGGKGNQKERLELLTRNFGIEDKIEFTGYIKESSLADWYSGAMCTIYLPRNEPFGLVPIESMSCGTPVIGLRSGGLIETVDPPSTGRLAHSLTPDDLGPIINELLNEYRKAPDQFEKSCRSRVIEKFSLETSVSSLRDFFVEISNNNP